MIQPQETIRIGQNERKPSEMLCVFRAFHFSSAHLVGDLGVLCFHVLPRCLRLLYLKAQPAEMGLGVNNLGLELTSANFVR